ncbi:ribokinase [Desulfuromonas versatilis]|uniref:Ribokinase n=1 Tax=Desulfuromonas versatilis TaxID=2802975 RepID=A0ABM8HTD8_9BACT|nr:ribokinase [Desulfuromonas versatilis]
MTDMIQQGGGPVATALVTLARLGVSTEYLGVVGGDDIGEKIRAGLLAEGVGCAHLQVDPQGTSQFAFIAVEKTTGHRNIFWTRGGKRPFSFTPAAREVIRRAAVLHLDGLEVEASLAAARFAREQGVPTVLDGGSFREGTAELLPFIDHLVVSEKFARQAFGEMNPAAVLEALLKNGAQAVTVTLGAAGSHTLLRGGEPFHQPAFGVEAVDTTGCGDVFHGGYIYGVLQGWPLRETVRFAAACAALKTRALGGRTAIPRLEEVRSLLEQSILRK